MSKSKNYWKEISNVKNEISNIIETIGYFPSITEIEKMGYNSLSVAISKYHGGMNNIRKIFNVPNKRSERDYWKDINNIKLECIKYIEKFDLENFTYKGLRNNGYHNIQNAIRRYGYKIKDICDELGIEYKSHNKNYLKDFLYIKNEVLKIIEEYNGIPTNETLVSIGKYSIFWAIAKYHGGRKEFFNKNNIKLKNKDSSLEISAKIILDKLLQTSSYVDNQRKKLLKFGINTKNPYSNQWLQIDRYYILLKLAVEIQGKQHYVPSKNLKHFSKEKVKKIIELDKIKASLLKEQNIKLLIIPYTKCSEEYIKKELIRLEVYKLGELLENPEVDNQQPSIANDIKVTMKVQRLEGEESTNNPSTSAQHLEINDDIVRTACITNEDAELENKELLG